MFIYKKLENIFYFPKSCGIFFLNDTIYDAISLKKSVHTHKRICKLRILQRAFNYLFRISHLIFEGATTATYIQKFLFLYLHKYTGNCLKSINNNKFYNNNINTMMMMMNLII